MASFLGIRIPFTADGRQFSTGLRKMRGEAQTFAGSLKGMFKDALSFAGGQAIFAGLKNAIQGVKSLGMQAIRGAADMESLTATFEVMIGSAERARSLLAELEKFSDATPFKLDDLAQGTKTLLQFGVSVEEILPTIKQLGDISGGSSEVLQRLTLVYGQIAGAGRLMGQDLLQLINAGFNPLQEISKKTGESMLELKKRMEAGGISFNEVKGAISSATSEGGRFFGLMEKQSTSMNGLWSTLVGAWEKLLRTIGQPINDWLKPMIVGWIENLKTLGDAISNSIKLGNGVDLLKQGLLMVAEQFGIAMVGAFEWAAKKAEKLPLFGKIAEVMGLMKEKVSLEKEEAAMVHARESKEKMLKATGAMNDDGSTARPLTDEENAAIKGIDAALRDSLEAIRGESEKATPETDKFKKLIESNTEAVNAPNFIPGFNASKKRKGESQDFSEFATDTPTGDFQGHRLRRNGKVVTAEEAAKIDEETAKIKEPTKEKLDIPSILSSDLAAIAGGGNAASLGSFDPALAEAKLQTDYMRQVKEYLDIISRGGKFKEPIA